ncbi:hypothetical protein [Prochlorococcus marinus]|uniref:hypothetical protein n=1 Tax=Prochlorococcus marinus TaxID=1219 RepID=UPI0022B2D577|nr:hypothetical protein [Prochlorococcus marinus]
MKLRRIFFSILVLCILLLLIIISLYNLKLNSDSLYIEVFQKSYFRDILQGDRWLKMPASAYFPDQIIYFIFRKIFNIEKTILILAISKILLLWYVLKYYIKTLYSTSNIKSYIISTIVVLMFVPSYKSGILPLYRIENNHFAYILTTLLVIPKLIKRTFKVNFTSTIITFLLCFISAISTRITLLVMFSFTFGYLVQNWLDQGLKKTFIDFYHGTNKNYTIAIFSGLIFGYLSDSRILNLNGLGERLIGQKNIPFFSAFEHVLNSRITPFVFVFGLLSIFLYKNSNIPSLLKQVNKINAISSASLFIILLNLRGIVDAGYYRYFYANIIIFIVNIIYLLSISYKRFPKLITIFGITISLLPYYAFIKYNTNSLKESIQIIDSNGIANCINNSLLLTEKDTRIGIGVQDYWDANISAATLKDPRIDIVVLNASGSPKLWMQNIGTLSSRYDNFYLLSKDNQKYLLPFKFKDYKICKDNRIVIKSLNNNAKDFIEYYSKISKFEFDILRNYKNTRSWYGNQLPSSSREQLKQNGVLFAKNKGFASYGPYVNLGNGKYKIKIFYSLINNNNLSNNFLEIGCLSKDKKFKNLKSINMSIGYGEITELLINSSKKDNCSQGYEARSYIDNGSSIYINRLVIEKIK